MAKCTQAEINLVALNTPHKPQRGKVQDCLANGWNVYKVEARRNAYIVMVMRGEMFAVLWPNGKMVRPLVGKRSVPVNWTDVIAAADLVRMREQEVVA